MLLASSARIAERAAVAAQAYRDVAARIDEAACTAFRELVEADGGTHVASTSQIGRIEVVKMESKGRGFRRLRIRIAE